MQHFEGKLRKRERSLHEQIGVSPITCVWSDEGLIIKFQSRPDRCLIRIKIRSCALIQIKYLFRFFNFLRIQLQLERRLNNCAPARTAFPNMNWSEKNDSSPIVSLLVNSGPEEDEEWEWREITSFPSSTLGQSLVFCINNQPVLSWRKTKSNQV